MFEVGSLLFFRPFLFKNGQKPEPKFFVVLGTIDEEVILASLPTSKNHIPASYGDKAGCLNDDEQCFNAYKFNAGVSVTETNYAFIKPTFIYGEQLDTYPLSAFLEQQYRGETIIEELGLLKADLFEELKMCLKNSMKVKRKFKRYLE